MPIHTLTLICQYNISLFALPKYIWLFQFVGKDSIRIWYLSGGYRVENFSLMPQHHKDISISGKDNPIQDEVQQKVINYITNSYWFNQSELKSGNSSAQLSQIREILFKSSDRINKQLGIIYVYFAELTFGRLTRYLNLNVLNFN